MTEFFRTHLGHRFYEQTMPELVRQLARLNDNLERLIERLPAAPPERAPGGDSCDEEGRS